jgi:hypothetical protein
MTNPGNDGIAQHGVAPAPWAARARKFIVAAVGLIAQVLASGVLDSPDQNTLRTWVQAILAVAFAFGVYQVPNAKSPTTL